ADWLSLLSSLPAATAEALSEADHAYGAYLGTLVKNFINQHQLTPDFIASHGHTIFHQPQRHISLQLGHGAYLAATAGLPTVCDFRTLDIALGGQGAPLVPIGDKLLFPEYEYCVNLGGIANLSCEINNQRIAFDSCACNMLLNTLAQQKGLNYDENGQLARQGQLHEPLFKKLNQAEYFFANFPKSLGKEWVDRHSLQHLTEADIPVEDKLHTACHHIALQLSQSLKALSGKEKAKVLLTGGGAFNTFLVELIGQYLGDNFEVVVPEPELVNFKEALIFAFLGVLRWRNEVNCLSSVTGASKDNCGGAVYVS
ncbi:MAG: anhydro-N-acetylmuramic acid kinase, partial [Hymenobacteraceae bacterium]|nr:anhydro-N-acetylmuramic acid kinase [Hymenobacteraceae bacterium]MDX5396161.1 anhydro-N-acetylmuramic acid kinase [Hymenobacteraceae bacterium]MDX5512224.1 anhydro-N-acetylmuramic acid kinase [Hymenobacteraceae bacterium]